MSCPHIGRDRSSVNVVGVAGKEWRATASGSAGGDPTGGVSRPMASLLARLSLGSAPENPETNKQKIQEKQKQYAIVMPASVEPSQDRRRRDPTDLAVVDGFRGMAHLWTFMFHLSLFGSIKMSLSSPLFSGFQDYLAGSWLQNGHLGTDVLFMISGFLLAARQFSRPTSKPEPSVGRTILSRFLRIYLPFLPIVLMTAASSQACRDVLWRYVTLTHSFYPMLDQYCGGHTWSNPWDVLFPAIALLVLFPLLHALKARSPRWLAAILIVAILPVIVAESGQFLRVRPPLTLFSLQSMISPFDAHKIVDQLGLEYDAALLPPDNFDRMHSYLRNYAWYAARFPAFVFGAVYGHIHAHDGSRFLSQHRIFMSAALALSLPLAWILVFAHPATSRSPHWQEVHPVLWELALALARPLAGGVAGLWMLLAVHADSASAMLWPLRLFVRLVRIVASGNKCGVRRLWGLFRKIGYSFSLFHVMVMIGYVSSQEAGVLFGVTVSSDGQQQQQQPGMVVFSVLAFWKQAAVVMGMCLLGSYVYYLLVERPSQWLQARLTRGSGAGALSKQTAHKD